MNADYQHHFDDKLEDALAMVAAGIPVEIVLSEAGADADWMAPLLAVASEAGQLKAQIPVPPPAASLNRMLAHAETMAAPAVPVTAPAKTSTGLFSWLKLGPIFATGFRTATLTAVVLIAFLAGTVVGTGMTMAAQNSVPGQPFYGLKRVGESFRLNLTEGIKHRQRLEDTFNLERQFETDLLLDMGKQVTVLFEDTVQSVSGTTFTIDGLTVTSTAETQISGGELAPGARVRIEALTQPPSNLQALRITVVKAAPTPTATPSPTATATPAPTQTPLPTPTLARGSDTLVLPTRTATVLAPDDGLRNTGSIDLPGNSNGSAPDDSNLNNNSDNGNVDNTDDFNFNSGDGGNFDDTPDDSDSGNDSDNTDDQNDDPGDTNDNSGDDGSNDNTDDGSNDNADDGSNDNENDDSDRSGGGDDSSDEHDDGNNNNSDDDRSSPDRSDDSKDDSGSSGSSDDNDDS